MYVKLGVFIMMGFLSLIPLTPVPWLLFEHIVPLLCLPSGNNSWAMRSTRLQMQKRQVPFNIKRGDVDIEISYLWQC